MRQRDEAKQLFRVRISTPAMEDSGIKMYIGSDRQGRVHSVVVTDASVHDLVRNNTLKTINYMSW